MWRLRWRDWMTEQGNDLPGKSRNLAAVPRASLKIIVAFVSQLDKFRPAFFICLLLLGTQFGHTQTDADKTVDTSAKPASEKRMFGIMPGYGIVEEGLHPPPLTTGQKFKLASQYIDPYTFAFVAAEAGIDQALNSPTEYGQGASGYGLRYGSGFADGLTNSIFGTAVYPTLLHQDPRYYRMGSGG